MGYKTIQAYATDEFIEKKSRFIGYIMPVTTEKEATDFIAKISKNHFDATHNVYAYILREGQIKRYSDNGEPQGTAGIPVLDVLQKEGLVDVCVVVTRYFGGTMLGAGGLVRAYSHGASIAVRAAKIMYMTECNVITLECEYTLYGKINYIIPNYNIKVQRCDFTAAVQLELLIEQEKTDAFLKEITDLSNGQVTPYITGQVFADMA
ncbi:YigZ family protein [Paludicola sp. MB14-C6]|uniref:YigZ family protein n=1 Tax=Paludihabitans sp. MB14-C6 TaxID=3070656 RepID=UPI0027DE63D8|nr:YigZ family protein [Paludicola sp. MB14-C6]WMJ23798.1 YigZ family protein [Paludicola sp. MB14-C6]